MTSETVLAETGLAKTHLAKTHLAKTHLAKTVLALTVLIFLTTGRAPGMRELPNPDSESGHARIVHMVKRMSA